MEEVKYEEINENTVCCANCKFFEERTCFCRRFPPKPIQITTGRNPYCIGMFPKVNFPERDYCGEFIKPNV